MSETKTDYQPRLVAVLRGIEPSEAEAVCASMLEAGLRIFEVTMNSPNPLESIGIFARLCADKALVGAGTVLDADDVDRIKQAGGKLIVAPNFNSQVVARAKQLDMIAVPGCLTATEIFTALDAGAAMIKVFPGDIATPTVIKGYKAVLPAEAKLIVTGGVDTTNIGAYMAAGAWGVGLGSALYKPGKPAVDVGKSARQFIDVYNRAIDN